MSEFHFLRPFWLLAFVPAALIAWRLWRSTDDRRTWRGVISEELLPHLVVGKEKRHRLQPVHMLLAGWLIGTMALAGPAWQREPAPFADDAAAVVIVLKVAPSMLTEDVQPDRLSRSVQKIRDLLKQRPGAKTALVAYAGSAHRVLPLTTDAEIVSTFAAELSPDILPREGDSAHAALTMASELLKKENERGWLLWIADSVAADQQAAIAKAQSTLAPTSLLVPETTGTEFETAQQAARAIDAELVSLTPDDTDVKQLLRRTVFSNVPDGSGGERWRDAGYFLVPVMALLTLFWFRRGWVIRGSLWGGSA
ncbi:MAG: VWA domain-containing protein [Planctomycetaceae bacterium]|nr:VWA domain-containing protein [Planctomycetaceae bacterium]